MRRRAMGQETEYGRSVLLDGRKTYDANEHLATITGKVAQKVLPMKGQFAANGARIYLDINGHVEYATPECDLIDDLVAHVLAGDRIYAQCVERYLASNYRGQEIMRKLQINLYRNNLSWLSDGSLDTHGTHENYQVRIGEDAKVRDIAEPLMAFLVARQLIVGAGRWRLGQDGRLLMDLAQRSPFIVNDIGSATTTGRAIVNTREESHAGAGNMRLHLILGDNNPLAHQLALKYAMTAVILTMIEEERLKWVVIQDPVAALWAINCDPRVRIPMHGRRAMTAYDMMRYYHDQSAEFVAANEEMAQYRPHIERWGGHLDRLARSWSWDDHYGELCWATKAVLLQKALERAKTGDASPEELALLIDKRELSMYQITGQRTAMHILQERFGGYDELAVRRALTTPPSTTRAHPRGLLVMHPGTTFDPVGGWSKVKLSSGQILSLPDPLDSSLPEGAPRDLAA